MYATDSIELLRQSGIDFAQNEARGIDVQRFGELLMSSGIVLNEEVSYDFRCLPGLLAGLFGPLLLATHGQCTPAMTKSDASATLLSEHKTKFKFCTA
jgi:hypothetical protein